MFFSSMRFSILVFALITSFTPAQKAPATIAEIGNRKITDAEFRIRYELSPFISQKSEASIQQRKTDFLYSLITEKLWYLEALNSGISESQLFRFYYQPIEDIHLRDALFKKEISDKVKLSADDVTKALMFAGIEMNTAVISGRDSAALFYLYNALVETPPVKHDSVLATFSSSGLSLNQFTLSLGSMKDAEVEEYLFTLNSGECSFPVRSELGWTMFLVRSKTSKPVDISNQAEVNRIKDVIRSRKILLKTEEYLSARFSNLQTALYEEGLLLSCDAVYTKLKLRFPDGIDTSRGKVILSDSDFRSLLSDLPKNKLQTLLFNTNEQAVTVFDFFAQLAFDELSFASIDKAYVYKRINSAALRFVESRMLTQEARRQGLLQAESVKRDLELWKESMLAHFLKISQLDSARVSDQEVKQYYETDIYNDQNQIYINVRILTLTALSEIEDVLRRVSDGATFDEAVRFYGATDPLVDSTGMTGLKPAAVLGGIGTIAAALELHQLYGPIRRDNGSYSLLMVKDKQRSSDAPAIDFEKDKEQLRSYLAQKKISDHIAGKTAELFKKYGVRINEEMLSQIKTNDIYMFTHRLMGFGGRLSAVPLLDNWSDWINIEQLRKTTLP